jgi:catechol-2,3-dioxygenase
VRDLERSTQWYRDVLGLEVVYEKEWGGEPTMLVSRGTGVALFSARADDQSEPAVRILHVAFRVDRANFDAARAALTARGIQHRLEDHVVSHSLYFEDPDGHRLELTTYEL